MCEKSLYFECYSGISGDMSVAALLDLGADEQFLRKTLEQLALPGYEIEIGRKVTQGIDTCFFDVKIPEQPHYDEGHGFHFEESCAHHHDHEECCEHDHDHHDHEACCEHDHHHGHAHGHHHHEHRNLHDIFAMLDRLDNEQVKQLSRKIFMLVAEAEAKAHRKSLDEIHFHEVGAIDSIVDVVSFSACFVSLGVTEVFFSALSEGVGHVHCQHGILPVPAPATLNILADSNLRVKITDNQGEMITPTGAAIASAICSDQKLPESFNIVRIGMGSGKKEFKQANLLRVMLIRKEL